MKSEKVKQLQSFKLLEKNKYKSIQFNYKANKLTSVHNNFLYIVGMFKKTNDL